MNSDIFIDKDNVSRDTLFSLFKDAYLNVEESPEGNGDYIQDRFKTWFDIDKKKEFIRFSLMLKVNPNKSDNEIYKAVNDVNHKYMMCRTFYNGNVLELDYYLWLDGGVSKKNIVFTYKFFAIASGEMVNFLLGTNVLL